MKKVITLLATLGFVFASTYVYAHSGRTDSKGCHTNHKTGVYHCHNPKKQ